jgi:hypothetical protein
MKAGAGSQKPEVRSQKENVPAISFWLLAPGFWLPVPMDFAE